MIYYILRLFGSIRGFRKVSAILLSISLSNTILFMGIWTLQVGIQRQARRFLAPLCMM